MVGCVAGASQPHHEQTGAAVARAAGHEQQQEAQDAIANLRKTGKLRHHKPHVAIKVSPANQEKNEKAREAEEKAAQATAAHEKEVAAAKARTEANKEFQAHLKENAAEMHALLTTTTAEPVSMEDELQDSAVDEDKEDEPTTKPPTDAEKAEAEEEAREDAEKQERLQATQRTAKEAAKKKAAEEARRTKDIRELASDVHEHAARDAIGATADAIRADEVEESKALGDSEASKARYDARTPLAEDAAKAAEVAQNLEAQPLEDYSPSSADAKEAMKRADELHAKTAQFVAHTSGSKTKHHVGARVTEEEIRGEADAVRGAALLPAFEGDGDAGVRADQEAEDRELREVDRIHIEKPTLSPSGAVAPSAVHRTPSVLRTPGKAQKYQRELSVNAAIQAESAREMKIQRMAQATMSHARSVQGELKALEEHE